MDIINKDDKSKLWSLFQNIKSETPSDLKIRDSVLIIDGLNTFIRCWSVSPTLNENGIHTGGLTGFLKSIGYAIKLFNPVKCILVFDGSGGSQKRKKIYPEYKKHKSNKIRINRAYAGNSTSQGEEDSFKNELMRTIQYLDCLPISTMSIDNIEADDAIAYIANTCYKDNDIVIMSSDKDFLQLIDNRIKVWSPTKKKLYGCAEVLSEYGISCENFINYRILDGDKSDNIGGVPGAGLIMIKKCFPIFVDHHRYSVDEVFNYADSNKGKYKLHDTILENKDIVNRNYQLMQLFDTQIQSFSQLRIDEILNKKITKLNRFEFAKLITEDKAWNNISGYQTWLGEVFHRLDNFIK